MNIDSNLLKEFAKITNDSEQKSENRYLRGTIVKNSGGKYVQLDGSTTVTPISELVDVEEGDRVLVSIENHKATIVGNFSFPPSARKEQEAIDKSEAAQETASNAETTANVAQQKAQEASDKADTAISQSSIASASADEAKEQATEAINKANDAQENVQEAKDLATQASADATEAKTQAAASQASSAEAQAEVTRLQGEVDAAKEDVDKALEDLESQAGEITAIKETYSTKVEVNNTKAELETTITTKVGELETEISETYSTKTENVELEGRLQTQITQNAEGLTSQATKIEKIEADTTEAQKDVADALSKANAAQTAASEAQTKADAAKTAADQATADATSAAEKATLAQNAADAATAAANAADQAVQEAQGDLDEAKQNLANVTSRVDATEADIAEAQQKVDAAQTSVNEALADAAEANAAATKAQEAADKAQTDAETAQGVATTAQQKAENAQTAADNAQSAADKAQADVAALTSRVTTAETKIEQNTEAISLNASKTEEIGERVDGVEDDLANNYYTKTETEAQIKVQSDRITSTVSRVETVENNAITSSVEQFYLSTSPTALSGGSWSTTQPTWTEGKYIWRRTYVTKGDGTTSYQPSQNGVCITGNTGAQGPAGADGATGADGQPGADGRGIVSTTVTYQGSTSGTTIPTGTWSTTIPTVAAGSYLWTRTVTTYTDNTTSTGYSVGMMGNTGATGPAGADGAAGKDGAAGSDGRGIKSAVTTYQAAANGTTIPTGTWSTEVPKTTASMPYLWTRTITTYTDNTTSTAYAIGATPEGIEVGGRNLLLKSKDLSGGSVGSGTTFSDETYKDFTIIEGAVSSDDNYLDIISWFQAVDVEPDTDYTLSFYAKGSGTFENYFYGSSGNGNPVSSVINSDGWISDRADGKSQMTFRENWTRHWVTWHTKSDASGLKDVLVCRLRELTEANGFICGPKFEKGNKATDWTPAPEDVDADIDEAQTAANSANDAAETANKAISAAESSIKQLADMIEHLVTDENGTSMMTQTSTGWTFNLASINGNLNAIKESLSTLNTNQSTTDGNLASLQTQLYELMNGKLAYITIGTDDSGNPCIELGKAGNDFKVRITNEAIDFMEGTSKIAYANNNTFYAEKMIVKNELQIGIGPGFVWRTRSSGNMGLVYISG